MTVQMMEEKSGIPRANIRYYEKEGLLHPVRMENGYREYSEEDLQTLLRIRLLRELGLSLEQIRKLQNGETSLSAEMGQQSGRLEREKVSLERAQSVCELIRESGASYETLHAEEYLEALHHSAPQQEELHWKTDWEEPHPWKRYFARSLDLTIYGEIVYIMGYGVWHLFSQDAIEAFLQVASVIIGMLVMLVVEPLLLSRTGTTLGKWIWGIRVTAQDGSLLSYRIAQRRTFEVIRYGLGFSIPGYNLYRLYKSRKSYIDGEPLYWEYGTALRFRDQKSFRPVGYVAAQVLIFVLNFFLIANAALPIYRGDLTAAEFAKNYNRYYDVYTESSTGYLDEEGRWQKKVSNTSFYIELGDAVSPRYQYQFDGDVITGVSLDMEFLEEGAFWEACRTHLEVAAISWICAQDGVTIFSGEIDRISEHLAIQNLTGGYLPTGSTSFTEAGIHVQIEIEWKEAWEGVYVKSLHLTMNQEKSE